MCIIKKITRIMKFGASTFRDASRGCYEHSDGPLSEIKDELLSTWGSPADDKKNLAKDRKNIERDIRNSFDKLVLRNG